LKKSTNVVNMKVRGVPRPVPRVLFEAQRKNMMRDDIGRIISKAIWQSVAAVAVLAASSSTPAQAATSWDATTDFDTSSNPAANGVWSYGWTATLGGTFALLSTPQQNPQFNLYTWNPSSSLLDLPMIGKSIGSGGSVFYTVVVDPNTLIAHPGPQGQYAVLRFTTPNAGDYRIDSSFFGEDLRGPTTTDVHVRTNNADTFSSNVSGFGLGSTTAWQGVVHLDAGQTVDFAVGFGSNGTYTCDSTGLTASIASISAIPEPPMAALLLAGLAGMAVTRKRRKNS
jgi:hypothetical protein